MEARGEDEERRGSDAHFKKEAGRLGNQLEERENLQLPFSLSYRR